MATETLGAALRQIKRLFAAGVISDLPDRRLLDLFIEQRDGDAFEILVARHGSMVLSVCRGILRDPNDVEDAFQATFLVLVKRAATIRGDQALGGWLYRVAHRVAVEANKAAARRRACEREAGLMASATMASGPTLVDQVLSALHEEIGQLPEKHRVAVVLCDLEGMTQAQAAVELRWSERTLRRRLGEARDRLKDRLGRRGLVHDEAMLGAVFLREARASVPASWQGATVQAALEILDQSIAVGSVSTAARTLTQEVLKTMRLQKLKLALASAFAAGLTTWAASAGLISRGDEPKAAPAAAQRAAPDPAPDPLDVVGTYSVSGRVLDPDGRPVAGAEVSVRHHAEIGWDPVDPMAPRQKGRVAVTDADGRFRFGLDKAAGDIPYDGGPGWHKAQVAVAATGFGLAWVEAGDLVKLQGREATIRLVRDDVPIRGRILDPQGRPVAGVVVRIQQIGTLKDGGDFDAMLASGELEYDKVAGWYGLPQRAPTWQADPAPLWPGGRDARTTGADGRFEIRGVGRDRIARLDFHGGGVADGTLHVATRPAKAPPRARPRPVAQPRDFAFYGRFPQGTPFVGATFDHVAGPTKPIAGVVRLKGSGKPVEGAIVSGIDAATHTIVAARTDAAGRFRIDGVPKGECYQIRVHARPGIDPFLRHWEIVDDTEGLKPIEQTFELYPGVIVTGRLVDKATGRAVPPAYIMYVKAPDNVGPEEDALGFTRLAGAAFGLTVPPGKAMIAALASVRGEDDPYICARLKAADKGKGIGDSGDGETVSASLSGYHTYRYIDVPAGAGPVAVDLELTRGLSREGRIIGPDGQPIVGAAAYGLGARWGNSRTLDRDSTFEIRGLEPGRPRLVIFTHKARKLVGAVVLKDEDMKSTKPLEVRLGPAGAIAGRLVDEDGHPLAGARLNVMMFDPGRAKNLPPGPGTFWPIDETFAVDAQGRFRVEGFVPGVSTDVSIEAANGPPGFLVGGGLDAGDAFRNLALNPGEARDMGDVKVGKRPQ